MNAGKTEVGPTGIGKLTISIVFLVGGNVLLEGNRLRAKLTDFGSAESCQVSYIVENIQHNFVTS